MEKSSVFFVFISFYIKFFLIKNKEHKIQDDSKDCCCRSGKTNHWKAGVISRYTTAALLMFDILYFMKKNVNRKMMNL